MAETMRAKVEQALDEVHAKIALSPQGVPPMPLSEITREQIDTLEEIVLALADRIDKLEGSGR
jgi:hypothetical protein